ncbi:glycoside hydrolase family 3 protein [Coniella lustricola]|uniref:beta-glucosidase n=1 Tax=Coniella lustricola TaxID=2025994 RepID=A0A2T3A1E0_9PEZI|nr:glycoside hydrolase family 3 protein [Coniella lustricola]
MRESSLVCAILATASAAIAASNDSTPIYKNPNATIDDRVADLLGRMTIQEKTSQLVQGDVSNWLNVDSGAYNESGLVWSMEDRGGSFYVGYYVNWTTLWSAIKLGQDYLVENTTLGIPAWVQSEGIHGFLIPNATIFNSPIAQACSWNPDLVEQMGQAIAQEASALGVNQIFGPLGDLARELRYGRVEETYGEDSFLAGEMAYSYVKGLQSGGVAAMVKHFAAYATPEQGINTSPVHGGERERLMTYLPSYKRAIIDAGAVSIMAAYHCYDSVPAVADYHLLTEILRNSWGYEYFVMSDAGGTDRLCTAFGMCQASPIDSEAIVNFALPAGTDSEMGGGSYNYEKIPDMVAAGTLDESVLDLAVSRVLRAKFEMGLFEKPFLGVPEDQFDQYVHTNATQQLARQLDTESIVLLENHNGVLPLSKTAHVAVIGPMAADRVNYGDYVPYKSGYRGVTPLEGFQAASEGTITYAKGCERWSNDESGFDEAIAAAEAADVAVVIVGTWSRDQGELWTGLNATTGEHIDVSSLGLVAAMPRLVQAIINTGKPTVVVFSSGKPISEPWISENATALVQQFYPSEQGGNALADVIYGNYNPSGRLSVSFPYDVGTTPIYYDYLNSARSYPNPGHIYPNGTLVYGSTYVFQDPTALYTFGYGLSYSTFSYSSITLSQSTATVNDTITISVDVTNNSTVDGTEVVQVYIKDDISSVVVPNKLLKGFAKVPIAAGVTETVNIDVDVADLGLWDLRLNYVVEPGTFTVYVGSSSADLRANATLTVT